ncbi:MAG: glycosyltransferase [Anaerolineae bacterium]|nr:glycosyltransferase [Anaerolineae bacterium]MBL6966774.1 glycosyltransferase [Anaerolineales bacterium]
MKRLHIAHFTNMYHPVINGVVRSVSAYRDAFTKMGHNVFVFAQHNDDYEDNEPFVFRYPSLDLPISVDIPAVIPVSPFVDRLLPALKLDLIHAHHPALLGLTAANKANKLDLPLVFTFHSRYQEYSHYIPLPQQSVQGFVKDMIHIWLGEFIEKCHHIVLPSESMRKILVEEYGLSGGYTVVPTGIDLTPFREINGQATRAQLGWQNDKVMISVGRLAAEKNWHTLIEASANAMQHNPDLRLAIIGAGPEGDMIRKLPQSLGIARRVDFLGRIPFNEIPRYLKAADCFVFASTSETQGLVTLEALAAGLPVVAVAASGTSDIVRDNIEGFTTRNDSGALSAAILQMFADPERTARFKSAAFERAQNFEINNQAKRLEAVYLQAIEDHKQGRFVHIENQKSLGSKIFDSVRP